MNHIPSSLERNQKPPPVLVVLDFHERRVARYMGRLRHGVWTMQPDVQLDLSDIEHVRAAKL